MRYKGNKKYSRQNGINNYKLNLMARRGHNYAYMSDKLYDELTNKGYKHYELDGERNFKEYFANSLAISLRQEGNYARIIRYTNKVRIPEYHIWYKPKTTNHATQNRS